MASIIIIGAGQAGLSTAYHLQQLGHEALILDAHARVGDSWRQRWDSLRLFSPARYSALPGLPMPFPPLHLPSKDEAADYLAAYATHFRFAVQGRTRVHAVTSTPEGFTLACACDGQPQTLEAQAVVVAAGTFARPHIPACAAEAAPAIVQLHTAQYLRPADLPLGPTLVVGTGASGTQIAAELAADRKVYLAGPATKHMPRRFLGRDLYWWLHGTGIMDVRRDSFLGRRLARETGQADFLIGRSLDEIVRTAGLERRGLVTGFVDGWPVFSEGAPLRDLTGIVWATGYRNDYGWLPAQACDSAGAPLQVRGVSTAVPGLYWIGLRFMYRVASSNMAGVGQDAAYVAERIAAQLGGQ